MYRFLLFSICILSPYMHFTLPFHRSILVLQAIHYSPPVALNCIVVRLHYLLK